MHRLKPASPSLQSLISGVIDIFNYYSLFSGKANDLCPDAHNFINIGKSHVVFIQCLISMESQSPRFSDYWQRRRTGVTVRGALVPTVYTAVAVQGREMQGLAVCSKQKEMAHAITSRSLQSLHHHLLRVRAVVRVGVSHAQTQCLPPSCAQQYIFTRTIMRTCSLDTGTTMLHHIGNKGAQRKLICITKEVPGDHSFVISGCNTNWREEKLSPISLDIVIIVFVIDSALLKGCLGLCVSPFPIVKVFSRK